MDRLKAADLELFRLIHIDGGARWLDPFFTVLTTTGVGWVQVLAILVASALVPSHRASSLIGGTKENLRRWGWRLLSAFLVSGALSTLLLKQVLPRERPSNLSWATPHELIYFDSFPSGHTTTSFGIAWMALFLTVGTRNTWLGGLALFWALLVGYSRIYLGVHWPTDALAGALVGLIGACLVYLAFRRIAPTDGGLTEEGPPA